MQRRRRAAPSRNSALPSPPCRSGPQTWDFSEKSSAAAPERPPRAAAPPLGRVPSDRQVPAGAGARGAGPAQVKARGGRARSPLAPRRMPSRAAAGRRSGRPGLGMEVGAHLRRWGQRWPREGTGGGGAGPVSCGLLNYNNKIIIVYSNYITPLKQTTKTASNSNLDWLKGCFFKR